MTWGPQLWSSTDDGPWELGYSQSDLEDTKVVFTGSAFLAVGLGEGGFAVLSSDDGTTWKRVPNDGLPLEYDDDCAPGWFTVSDGIILLGQESASCPPWLGSIGA
jgi:hypothetical protein